MNLEFKLEKQKLIIDLFKEWVWQDEDRIWEIEENYMDDITIVVVFF